MWVMVCAGMWAGEKIGLLKGRGLSLLLFIVWFFMLFFALFVFFVCWVVVLFWVLLICLLFGCFGFVDGLGAGVRDYIYAMLGAGMGDYKHRITIY